MPIILHIPHSSRFIPETVKDQFTIREHELEREVNLMTDHFTDWLLAPLNVPTDNHVVSNISRLVVDMERFSDDALEVMSQIGMGVLYERGSQLQSIRRKLSNAEKQALITRYYDNHHKNLEERTQAMLQKYGKAIIIDVHSYPKFALPYERDHAQKRPEICIGTCDYHTPKELASYLINAFTQQHFDVDLNTPFAGTLIPSKHWKKEIDVTGFMIEVRRDVYMDEDNFRLSAHSDDARHKICLAIQKSLDLFFNLNGKQ